ncbi:MAG: hypothetical protein ACOZAO_01670 [Patescibacteria group bacterium]
MATLKASFPEKCIGCELCVMEAQRQLEKVGLEGALIRVLRNSKTSELMFYIDIDPQINNFDIQEIKKICPTLVFTVEEDDKSDDFSS